MRDEKMLHVDIIYFSALPLAEVFIPPLCPELGEELMPASLYLVFEFIDIHSLSLFRLREPPASAGGRAAADLKSAGC